jgi:energy-converting hydrogenase Eha subunit C
MIRSVNVITNCRSAVITVSNTAISVYDEKMKKIIALLLLFTGMYGIVLAVQNEDVLVDTLCTELPLTNSIFHSMDTGVYYSDQLYLPDFTSGIYFLKVEAGQKSEIRRIIIVE